LTDDTRTSSAHDSRIGTSTASFSLRPFGARQLPFPLPPWWPKSLGRCCRQKFCAQVVVGELGTRRTGRVTVPTFPTLGGRGGGKASSRGTASPPCSRLIDGRARRTYWAHEHAPHRDRRPHHRRHRATDHPAVTRKAEEGRPCPCRSADERHAVRMSSNRRAQRGASATMPVRPERAAAVPNLSIGRVVEGSPMGHL
jgi:hypothetical protein